MRIFNIIRFFCSFGYLSRPLFIRALFFCLINYWNNIYNDRAGGCGRLLFCKCVLGNASSRSSKLLSSAYIEYIYTYYSHDRLLITNHIVSNMFLTPIYSIIPIQDEKVVFGSARQLTDGTWTHGSLSFINHISIRGLMNF